MLQPLPPNMSAACTPEKRQGKSSQTIILKATQNYFFIDAYGELLKAIKTMKQA